MAKTYVLKEPEYLRQQALEAVALLRYMRVFSDGKEISPTDEDAAARPNFGADLARCAPTTNRKVRARYS